MHLVLVETFLWNGIVLESCLMAVGMRCRHDRVKAAAGGIELYNKVLSKNPRFG